MREIKFRAWLKKEKKMVKVSELRDIDTDIISDQNVIYFDFEKQEYCNKGFDEVELMQYTGLKDKNGVEIYEGDIAKLPAYLTNNTEYAICKWLDNRFSVEDVIGFGFIDQKEKKVISDEWEDFEVIGNIYENPELLEK